MHMRSIEEKKNIRRSKIKEINKVKILNYLTE